MKTIAIIGGGLSGTLLAINVLILNGNRPLRLSMVERSAVFGLGLAYSTEEPSHLLNVPAGKMSAFPDDPLHLFRWLTSQGIPATEETFIPRSLYGQYIRAIFDEAIQTYGASVELSLVPNEEAVAITTTDSQPAIHLKSGRVLLADQIVLALGNFLPAHLALRDTSYVQDQRYFQNPWDKDRFRALAPHEDILLIGTGLTSIDMITSLYALGHQGTIWAASSHGYLPAVHILSEPYPDFGPELLACTTLSEMTRVVKRHRVQAKSAHLDWRVVIDAVRPYTQLLWQKLSLTDKKHFLRHLNARWNVARHRMPAESAWVVQHLREENRLQILAGRIQAFTPYEDGIECCIADRHTGKEHLFRVGRILNCTGPQNNLEKVPHPLVQHLWQRGMLLNDPFRLGFLASPDGRLLDAQFNPSSFLYTLGPPLKGALFESVAVPEIRCQAKALALQLLQGEAAFASTSS